MIFTNARLIFPDGIRDGLEVVVEQRKIAAIRPPTPRLRRTGERVRGKEVIDLNGNYLASGFIDLHVHGALGRDTMEASAEAFRSICDFHASGGTTSLLLTTATAPLDEIVKVLQAVLMSKGHLFRKRKPERNASSSFRTRHRLLCSSCSNTRTY